MSAARWLVADYDVKYVIAVQEQEHIRDSSDCVPRLGAAMRWYLVGASAFGGTVLQQLAELVDHADKVVCLGCALLCCERLDALV